MRPLAAPLPSREPSCRTLRALHNLFPFPPHQLPWGRPSPTPQPSAQHNTPLSLLQVRLLSTSGPWLRLLFCCLALGVANAFSS